MKLTMLKILLMMFLFSSSAEAVRSADSYIEGMSSSSRVSKIDLKKKIITVNGMEIGYNASTVFVDAKGNKISSKLLQATSALRFEINPKRRFLSRPMATKIWILSVGFE